jgi:Tol biopolymer transport system component
LAGRASGAIRQLTHEPEDRPFMQVHNWSPDGQWIAYDRENQLCAAQVESAEWNCFDVFPPGANGDPIPWSPDSTEIAVMHRASQSEPWDIYLIRVADGTMTRLTYDGSYAYHLLWRR